MEFKSGDDVVHPSYGVGNIVRLEDRQLAENETRQYYVLVFGKTTVFTPVQASAPSVLRLVTARQDLEQYRTLLKSCPVTLDRDFKKRRLEIQLQLARGSFQVVCEVVRDLTALSWQRPMNEMDASVLKRVRSDLWQEWSMSTGQPLPDVIQEVTELLQIGESMYRASSKEKPHDPPRQLIGQTAGAAK